MNNYKIPFNRPFLVGKELYYIAQSVLSGNSAGDGLFTKKCHTLIEEKFDVQKILLTPSCTAALEMAALLCQLKTGDEVVLPSFTFVSTVNAFYSRGVKPIFVDIRPDTLNIDEKKIEEVITKKTKIIIPVHYAGVACEMNAILEIAQHHNLRVVEDAAHGFNAKYKDRHLGTIGDIGTFSFHETKNIICGEGGAIAINDAAMVERAEILREKGTNRSQFFRGQVDKYTWVDVGSSYLLSDLLAAFLYAQLEKMNEIQKQRMKLYQHYVNSLIPLANDGKMRLPYLPSECQSNYHLFYIILENEKTRNDLMEYLKANRILAVFHYIPLHTSDFHTKLYKKQSMPNSEKFGNELLRLPFFCLLSEKDIRKICNSIKLFYEN